LQGGQLEAGGPLTARRQYAIEAEAQRGRVAIEREFDRLASQRLDLAVEQRLGR
jgi:hypothetical protein